MRHFLNSILFLFLFVSSKAQRVKIFLDLSKGSVYYITGASHSKIAQRVNGQETTIDMYLSYRMSFKVLYVTDSVYQMQVSYENMDIKFLAPNKILEMDSKKNDKQDIPSSFLASMMNRPFSMTMSKSGKITSVKNIENVITDVFRNFPQLDEVKKAQIRNSLIQTYGEAAFKSNLEMQTAIYPILPVTKNSKWIVNSKIESKCKMNLRTVYQLTNIKDGFYWIHGKGAMISDRNSKTNQINGMPVLYNLSGVSESDFKIDIHTGWISSSNIKQVIKGNTEILKNPHVPGGMKIPMMITTDVITTQK